MSKSPPQKDTENDRMSFFIIRKLVEPCRRGLGEDGAAKEENGKRKVLLAYRNTSIHAHRGVGGGFWFFPLCQLVKVEPSVSTFDFAVNRKMYQNTVLFIHFPLLYGTTLISIPSIKGRLEPPRTR